MHRSVLATLEASVAGAAFVQPLSTCHPAFVRASCSNRPQFTHLFDVNTMPAIGKVRRRPVAMFAAEVVNVYVRTYMYVCVYDIYMYTYIGIYEYVNLYFDFNIHIHMAKNWTLPGCVFDDTF